MEGLIFGILQYVKVEPNCEVGHSMMLIGIGLHRITVLTFLDTSAL